MTTIALNHAAGFDGFFARIRGALADRAAYRRTLAELTAHDVREREDIGLAGADLEAVAREAVYGR
jgi:uncharacterized protein YjiS (DUF1127 family)